MLARNPMCSRERLLFGRLGYCSPFSVQNPLIAVLRICQSYVHPRFKKTSQNYILDLRVSQNYILDLRISQIYVHEVPCVPRILSSVPSHWRLGMPFSVVGAAGGVRHKNGSGSINVRFRA